MKRQVAVVSLLFGACGAPDSGMPLPARRYTFDTHGSACEAVVLDIESDGSAFLQRVGRSESSREPALLERHDAEVFILPADGVETIELLDASSAILRRTSCSGFDVTFVRAYGRATSSLFAADPCIEEIPPPENGDEWDPCRLRYCNEDPC